MEDIVTTTVNKTMDDPRLSGWQATPALRRPGGASYPGGKASWIRLFHTVLFYRR